MIATRRAADTMMILIVLLMMWQALHQVVGATALPGPVRRSTAWIRATSSRAENGLVT